MIRFARSASGLIAALLLGASGGGFFAAPAFARPAFDALSDAKAKLSSSDGRERRAAVGELARVGNAEAWKLVLGALEDPDAQVADEAQLKLAQVSDPGLRKLLLGKEGLAAKDALVRERVAESFGRLEARPAAEVLAAGLGDREVFVRRTAAWSIERLAVAGKFREAWDTALVEMSALEAALAAALAREKDAEAFATLSLAQQALLGAPRRKDIDALVASKAPASRVAAAIALRSAPAADALLVLRKLAGDPASNVRIHCARTLAALEDAACARELVALLERETQLRAKWLYVEHLRALSGLAHRLDARPWRAWAEALGDGPISVPAARTDDPQAPSTAAFAGLPILSERVTFLIDLSGSMWDKRADGRTRKEVVADELERALRSLSAQVRFNVIVYTARPVAWKERLAPAAPKAIEDALEFFAKRSDRGTGDFWGAFEVALADPDVDTVILLGDGAPSGGERWNLELMQSLFVERARLRAVVLEAVLAGASKRLVESWRQMCASSGGRVVEFRLD